MTLGSATFVLAPLRYAIEKRAHGEDRLDFGEHGTKVEE